MVITTVNYAHQFLNIFAQGPSEADSNDAGMVNCGDALFDGDGFRVVNRVEYIEDEITFEQACLAVMFIDGMPLPQDGQNMVNPEVQEGFPGNHFDQTVVIYFMTNEEVRFNYNGHTYILPSAHDPNPEYNLMEVIRWWIFKILRDEKHHTGTGIKWQILMQAPEYGWEEAYISGFGSKDKSVGFSIAITVRFEIDTNPYGE